MRRLRGPGGCPWDREQTIQSLRPFVLEETYEVLDAIDRGDHDALRGEIGDLLFEGVFLAQLEADEGRFTVSDSLREISAKLIRRHPHVFGATDGVTTAGQGARAVGADQVPRAEARRRAAVGAARHAEGPAVAPRRARDRHARRRGRFRLGAGGGCRDQDRRRSRRAEAGGRAAKARRGSKKRWATCCSRSPTSRASWGSSRSRRCGRPIEKFTTRFQALERALEAAGRSVHDATLEEMEAVWERVKGAE